MAKAPHAQADIQPPQGVAVVDVDAASGLVWQSGCGPSVREAFLSGTEPRQPCGYFDGSQMLSIYEEPALMSDAMAAEMAPYDTSMSHVEIVDDPDMADVQEADTVVVEEPTDTAQTKPPEVRPPVVKPPIVQPPVPVPPTPRDTLADSLSIRSTSALVLQHLPDARVFGTKHPYGEATHFFLPGEIQLCLECAYVLEEEPFVNSAYHVGGIRHLLDGIPLDGGTISLSES